MDLFGNPQSVATAYPPDAICAVGTCGHLFAQHNKNCGGCLVNAERGFSIEDPGHVFRPRMLAGQIVTPSTERNLLDQVRRGE